MTDPSPRPPRRRVDRLTLATYAVLLLVALLVLSEAVALRDAGKRLRASAGGVERRASGVEGGAPDARRPTPDARR